MRPTFTSFHFSFRITEEGAKKLRYRLKKKLELEDSLEEFVSKVK